jgi:Zn-dependent protease
LPEIAMLKLSLPVGRAVGATVRVHWTALVIAALLGSALVVDLGTVVGIVGVVSFFVAILLHEIAHALVARRFGIRTESIELWGLGGMARLDRDPATPRADGFIAAAGPLSNAVFGGVAVAAAWLLRGIDLPDAVVVSVGWFAAVNLVLAAFNVLPGAPLDGGRVVRAVRWSQHGNRYRAMREAAYVGGILGWGLLALGASFMLSGRSGVWMIVSGLFVVMSARVEVFTATIGERIGPAKVNEFTWFGVAEVGPDMDVDSMIWQRSRLGGAGAVAVRGAGGSLDGLVLEDQLWAVPADRRAWTMLTSLMAPLDRLPRADVDDDLAVVLPRVHPLRPVITVWRDGRLLGVVPPKVVRERIESLAARLT